MKQILSVFILLIVGLTAWGQAPGTTPVEVSHETQMLHGRKYYVHIVKTGQTVYSISRAYKVESYDAVTHVDIHFLHQGDTVWLPVRGQFAESGNASPTSPTSPASPTNAASTPSPSSASGSGSQPSTQLPEVRRVGKTLKVGLMMPLHLDQMEQISTSKFDVEQRGKKSYRQFEFIEFYEGLLLALDKLAEQGIGVELNVADVSGNTPAQVEQAFTSHQMGQCDFVVALLLRDCFDKAAELAQQAGVYIVNPMATRSELCADNPYMVKIQPSLSGMIALTLANMKFERPDGHLYIIHSNSAAEKPALEELKRQLAERGDIKYTIFNWSQSARLASVLKATPKCNVLSIYDQGKDNNRVFSINLLNRLASIKKDSPTLYTLTDWTREYSDIDFSQLQLLGYHTYSLAWDMTNDVHVQFLQAFRTRFGSEPTSQLAATAYDLMLYIGNGLARRNSDFWRTPGNSLPALVQPLHLGRSGAGLENDKAQLYRLEDLRFIKALFK
ncbi:MAG: ABC transporter substrate-binding protein [Bacteroidales bacterium]|nr:ABC transporter substrate-binding protein [Bacteroidales bacterium]